MDFIAKDKPTRLQTVKNYAHLRYLGFWAVYLALFFLTERLISPEQCHVVYLPVDDAIPFCEFFLLPYVGWYFAIGFSLYYLARKNPQGFMRFEIYLTAVQMLAMLIYLLYPTRQDLRPESFPRDNLMSRGVALLYATDTNTGVCPSLHVAISIAMVSAWLKENISLWGKIASVVFACAVILSVSFLKQHSVVDILVALPLCLIAECIAYAPWYRQRTKKAPLK